MKNKNYPKGYVNLSKLIPSFWNAAPDLLVHNLTAVDEHTRQEILKRKKMKRSQIAKELDVPKLIVTQVLWQANPREGA